MRRACRSCAGDEAHATRSEGLRRPRQIDRPAFWNVFRPAAGPGPLAYRYLLSPSDLFWHPELPVSRAPASGRPNTRDKLRSSNTLGFVSFIPLLGGLVVPPSVVGSASRHSTPLSHRVHGNADVEQARHHHARHAIERTKASLKSDALSSLVEPSTTCRRQQSRR